MEFISNIIYFFDGTTYYPLTGSSGGDSEHAVLFVPQVLTAEQQAQALENLGVVNAQNTSY